MAKKQKRAVELAVLDLGTKSGQAQLAKLQNPDEVGTDYIGGYLDASQGENFFKTGETKLYVDGSPVFEADNYLFAVKNGIVTSLSDSGTYGLTQLGPRAKYQLKDSNIKTEAVICILLPSELKSQKYFPVIAGDEDFRDSSLEDISRIDGLKSVTVSFECLRRFYDTKKKEATQYDAAKKLIDGTLSIVDYIPDNRIDLNAEEKKVLKNWKAAIDRWENNPEGKKRPACSLKPPKAGYTLVGNEWHCSATVLFYDSENDYTILIGQDEGTYFGVQLADNPKTVASAYTSLIPKEIRNISGWERQGEWFAVPVAEPPAVQDCIIEGSSDSCGTFSLNRDSDDSAHHNIESDEIRVGKDGIVYANNPTLAHENNDHADLVSKGWVAYYRNTAVRAFSVQGVD